MRKLLFSLLFFACLGAGVYFFRAPLAIKGLEWSLTRALPSESSHELHYDSVQFDQGRLVIRGLQLAEEGFSFLVDEAEMVASFDFKHFRLNGHLQLNHPLIQLGKRGEGSLETFTQLFFPSKRLSLGVEAKGGVVETGGQRFYFQMHSSGLSIPEGEIAISQDPSLLDHPFFIAKWSEEKGSCVVNLKVDPIAIDRASDLIAFALKPTNLELSSGIVEVNGSAILNAHGALESYTGNFFCQQLELSRGAFIMKAEHVDGAFTNREGASLNLSGGELIFDGHTYATEVALSRTAEKLAKWKLEGKTDTLGSFTLEGGECKGGAEGGLYFPEIDASVAVSMTTFQPGGHLATFKVSGWNPKQTQAIFNEFSYDVPSFKDLNVLEGEVNAKCTLVIENGALTSIDLQSLTAKSARFTVMNKVVAAATVSGTGRFTPFGVGEMSLDIQGTFGLPTLKSEPARLTAAFTMKKGSSGVSGSATLGEESIQFGFESRRVIPRRLEEIFEAWVRAEHLSPKLYGPLIGAFSTSTEVEGIVDLFGTFDGEKLDLSLQSDSLLVHHPWADLKAKGIGEKDPMLLRTGGRATMTYHLSNRCFCATLPLTNAALYQRHTGCVFDQMTGTLSLHHDPDRQSFALDTVGASVRFDGKTCLTEIKSTLRGDLDQGEVVFDNFTGRVNLPLEGEYYLSFPTLKREQGKWDAQALLFDSKKSTLATLSAKLEKEFHADISLRNQLPISGEVCVGALFDPGTGSTVITCESHNLLKGSEPLGPASLKIKNQGNNWQIESLKLGKGSLSGVFTLNDGALKFSEVQTHLEGMFFQGEGLVYVDFPTEESPLSLRGQWIFDAEMHQPFPIQLRVKEPVKIAYTISEGFAVSDLNLETGSSKLRIGLLEGKEKWHAHQCDYSLHESLVGKLITQAQLPPFVSSLILPSQMEGTLNADWEKGTFKASGKQESNHYTFDLGSARNWSLSIADSALLSGWVKESGVTIEKIQGEIAGQQLDLKGSPSGNALVGTAIVDFQKLTSLVALPKPLSRAGFGQGFKLDGEFTMYPSKTFGFKGRWRGSDFSALGYHLRSLDAKAELTADHLMLENCMVIDDAGKFTAQKILFASGKMELPRGELKNFQPSFLRPLDGPERLPSSLMIKTALVEGLTGTLGKAETFEAQGSFRFSGALDRMELPNALVGSQWEGAIQIPLSGEADYKLKAGKCHLTSLRECHLSLSGQEGYVDFDGNYSLELQLQANQGNFLDLELKGSSDHPEFILR